jgi:hypothetical protein
LRTVGALLEAKAVHKGRSAYDHLLCLAQSQRLPRRRVDEVRIRSPAFDGLGIRRQGHRLGRLSVLATSIFSTGWDGLSAEDRQNRVDDPIGPILQPGAA